MQTIQIVLADDEAIQRKNMTRLIEQACQSLQVIPVIHQFKSGEAFLFALEEHPEWQIAFLDIEMDELNGMEVAHKICEQAPYLQIVFATAYAEYAVEGYQVNALDFLLKPIKCSAVKRVLAKYLMTVPKTEKYFIVEDRQGQQHVIEMDELLSVEVNKRELRLNLGAQEFFISGTLANFKDQLDQRFVTPHRSYLVNLNHVESIGKDDIVLTNNERVPISRRLVKEIQKAFIEHYKEEAFYG
ncbi:LytR/AlgR family response regulator transcription factor [Facklamia lactis]|uniref:LytR/AlgR family response regulator transcription factor n=1 Tax=Facklamia lactis TaxID=2749967 RepID=UPI0018CE0ED3|nr:LytTR family DNA-binding domain-containing protein [Facklamia lactis]MBG9981207.1 response regulator transcription factor [Facklamia lactis]